MATVPDHTIRSDATLPLTGVGSLADGSGPQFGAVIDGRYRLEAKLGSGGMGAVYRATRLSIGDEIAIKLLHPSQVADSQSAERFRREAQTAARLKHPNAVNIYDFGITADGLFYLVMELVPGESVRTIIKQHGPFTPTAAAQIVTQVSAALDEAHRQQIVHRDIKPDNIMVRPTIDGLRVKVLDFGIAKLRDQAASNLTQTGSVMGTPHYMSPEQCLGEELDSRSDVYSLGVVLYEMLAGVVPFNSPTSTAVVVQHVNQAPSPLRALNPSIPPAVEAVVLHALEKRRESRPQSAGALANELNAALQAGASPSYAARLASTQSASGFTPISGEQPTVVMTATAPSGGSPLPAGAPQYMSGPQHYLSGQQPVVKRSVVMPVALAVVVIGFVGAYFLLRSTSHAGPLPDHFGIFVRTNDALGELRRGEFHDVMKAREALMGDSTLPQVPSKPTLILYSEGNDIPLNDLKLMQLDTVDASGKVSYWNFQVSPVEGHPGMRQLRVAGGLASGKYAFALIDGFMDDGNHRFWPFQVKDDGAAPSEAPQAAMIPLKPKPAPMPTPSSPPPVARPTTPAAPPSGASVAYARTNNLLVRSGNSLTAPVIGKLHLGQRVYVLQFSNNFDVWHNIRSNWAYVQVDGLSLQGWVFTALLRQ